MQFIFFSFPDLQVLQLLAQSGLDLGEREEALEQVYTYAFNAARFSDQDGSPLNGMF